MPTSTRRRHPVFQKNYDEFDGSQWDDKLILCKLFCNFYIIVHKNRFSLTFTLKRFTIEKM